MIRTSILAVTAALAVVTAAQAADISRSYKVGDFDKVAAAGPHRFIVSVGSAGSVRATGDAAVLDKMEVVVKQGALQIRPKEAYRRNFSWKDLPRATYHVTVPRLTDAALAGSGAMAIDRVGGGKFSASVAGSGDMRIAEMQVDHASISVAGSGGLTVSGRTDKAEISVAGSGTLHGRGLAIRAASVSVSGSGGAELTARDTADVSVVGSGKVDVAGSPKCSVSRIGSGKVRCGA